MLDTVFQSRVPKLIARVARQGVRASEADIIRLHEIRFSNSKFSADAEEALDRHQSMFNEMWDAQNLGAGGKGEEDRAFPRRPARRLGIDSDKGHEVPQRVSHSRKLGLSEYHDF